MNILIVDDSKASRMIVKRALRQAGYGNQAVQEANDGVEALGVIVETKPSVVLCDWNMPKMSGIELLEKLKAEGIHTKLGFVTSEGTDDVRQQARAAGAAFFVSKPVTAEKLEGALGQLLSST